MYNQTTQLSYKQRTINGITIYKNIICVFHTRHTAKVRVNLVTTQQKLHKSKLLKIETEKYIDIFISIKTATFKPIPRTMVIWFCIKLQCTSSQTFIRSNKATYSTIKLVQLKTNLTLNWSGWYPIAEQVWGVDNPWYQLCRDARSRNKSNSDT